jgi:hypothetical protein
MTRSRTPRNVSRQRGPSVIQLANHCAQVQKFCFGEWVRSSVGKLRELFGPEIATVRADPNERQPMTTHGLKARITLAESTLIVPAFME